MRQSAIDALLRRKLLEKIYDRMTDEERRLFIQMTMQQKSQAEIMDALQAQRQQLQRLYNRQQTFSQDFASNIAGNAVWAGADWLFRKLMSAIR